MYIFFIYPTPVFGGGVKDAACGCFLYPFRYKVHHHKIGITPVFCFISRDVEISLKAAWVID